MANVGLRIFKTINRPSKAVIEEFIGLIEGMSWDRTWVDKALTERGCEIIE